MAAVEDMGTLLAEVAESYYVHQKTQAEIAKEFKTSRGTVQRWLQQAKEQGIVKIEISHPAESLWEMEKELVKEFGLKGAVVVQQGPMNLVDLNRRLGRGCAQLLKSILMPNMKVGIGWGSFYQDILMAMEGLGPYQGFGSTFVPLLGWIPEQSAEAQVSEICRRFAEICQGRWVSFYLPLLVEKPATKQALLNDAYVQEALASWDDLDLAVVGIGTTQPRLSEILARSLGSEVADIYSRGLVGDICARFFDGAGRLQPIGFDDRMLSIPLPKLREADTVVAVAGGEHKLAPILAALCGHWIDILVTDAMTGQRLLQLARQP